MITPSQPNGNGHADTLSAALAYHAAGLSVIPVKCDGSKAPACPAWEPYQSEPPDREQVERWFRGDHPRGIGVVGGAVSGALAVIDFEFADFWDEFRSLLEAARPGFLAHLPLVKTPGKDEGGGRHLYLRARRPVATGKLARLTEAEAEQRTGDPKRVTAVEVKAEGGYVLAPGCPAECHPSGRLYEHIAGPPLTDIPTLEDDELDDILSAARSLNRAVNPSRECGEKAGPAGEGLRPGDDFNARATWDDILTPHGWRKVGDRGDGARWCRPGKAAGVSATTGYCKGKLGDGLLYVFSTNADPFEDEHAYSKFVAHALLDHGGDFNAAARSLAAEGYGERRGRQSSNGTGRAGGAPGQDGKRRGVPTQERQPVRLATTALSDIKPEPVHWLVLNFLPLGKLVMLAGDGGHGKSSVTLNLTADLTRGLPCFGLDCAPMLPCEVLLIGCEDDYGDTVVPRCWPRAPTCRASSRWTACATRAARCSPSRWPTTRRWKRS